MTKEKEYLNKLRELGLQAVEKSMLANKWKMLIDTDYITLFVKTWFAFLSSIKTIIKFEKTEILRGDSILLSKYTKSLVSIIEKDMVEYEANEKEMVDVLRMFKIGLKLLPKELPFSIFGLYMQINEKIENKEVYDNKIYKAGISIKNKDKKNLSVYLYVYIKKEREQFHLKKVIKKSIIYKVFDDYLQNTNKASMGDCLKKIFIELSQEISNEINNEFVKNKKVATIMNRVNNKLLNRYKSMITRNYKLFANNKFNEINNDMIISPLPCWCFDIFEEYEGFWLELNFNKVGGQFIKWQIKFIYTLRNFLFHGIIDPLDDKWQTLLKSTCDVLRSLVDLNTTLFSSFLRNKNMFKKNLTPTDTYGSSFR